MGDGDGLERKRARLSPEKQALLRRRLRQGALGVADVDGGAAAMPGPPAGELAEVVAGWSGEGGVDLPFDELVEAAAARAGGLPAPAGRVGFFELSPGLNDLAVAAMGRAFRDLGLFAWAGERRSAGEVAEGFGVVPQHRKLARRWLMTLAERGRLARSGEDYACGEPLPLGPPAGLVESLGRASRGTAYEGVVRAAVAVNDRLADALRGDAHAAETFFAESSRVVDAAYGATWEARYCLEIVAGAVGAAAARVPAGRRLRVLEIGAGVGATTRTVLPSLPAEKASYVFTDVSDYFLAEARAKFAGAADMHFGRLNIDEPLERAGCAAGAFDLVLATGVMHCARLLDRSLGHVRRALRPGGALVLVEATRDEAWHQTSMGLLKGFMNFEDGRLARNVPLLPPAAWREALSAAGFGRVACLPGGDEAADVVGQHVFLAAG